MESKKSEGKIWTFRHSAALTLSLMEEYAHTVIVIELTNARKAM